MMLAGKNRLRPLPMAVAACLFGFGLPARMGAQSPAAPTPAAEAPSTSPFSVRITGAVWAYGVPVPGASVVVTDRASGQKYLTSTDEHGRFLAVAAHAGVFEVSADMLAFAPTQAVVTVSADAVAPPPLVLQLSLASAAPGSSVTVAAASGGLEHSASAGNRRPGSTAGAGGQSRAREQRTASGPGYQSLDLNQTGAFSPDSEAQDAAAAAQSGIAGMSESTATSSAVVTGEASPDAQAMSLGEMARMVPPGGGFGRGGGFGGRGGFSFRRLNNRFDQPHGNLSYGLSDSALNALPDSITGTNARTGAGAAPHTDDQSFSATLTTPLKIPHVFDDQGKTSLTVAFSLRRNNSLQAVNALVPTLAERSGDFQGLTDSRGNPITLLDPSTHQAFPGNTLTGLSPAALGLLAYVPEPTSDAVGRFNYSRTLQSLGISDRLSLRVNHSFGAAPPGGRGRGFGRFGGGGRSLGFSLNYEGGNHRDPGVFYPAVEGFTKSRGVNMSVFYAQPLAGWTNIFRVNYNRDRTDVTNLYAGVTDVAAGLGIGGVSLAPIDWGLPTLSFSTSGLTGLSDVAPSFVRSQTWSVNDGMIRRLGRHNVRLGAGFNLRQEAPETSRSPRGDFTFDGEYTGYDFADFLLGMPQQTSVQYGGGVFYFRQLEPSVYAEDNWQVKGNLTLSYGLRWEYVSPYTEQNNRLTNLAVGPDFSSLTQVFAAQNGVRRSILEPNYSHFRPSLGFAWKTWDNLIVRGGAGMAYNTGAYENIVTALAYQAPYLIRQTNLASPAAPLTLTNGFPGTGKATADTFAVNPGYQVGYSYLWNLDVARQIGRGYLVNLDYSGSRGLHLDQLRAPNRTTTGLLYPGLPVFLYDTTGGSSIYNGGSLIVSRRLSHSLSLRARYTYSKMMDDASQIGGGGGIEGLIAQNDRDLDAEWARSSQDQTHRFDLSYEWQLPYGLNHRWGNSTRFLASALGDWQLSGSFHASSGQPLTPLVSNLYSNAQGLQALGVTAPLRANWVLGAPIGVAAPSLTQFFNTSAFTAPPGGSFGDAGRNIILGPGQVLLNLAISKDFRLGEYRSLEIRFSGDNALNHPNWSGVDTNLNSATFGAVTGFGAPRQITFSARFRY